MPAPDPRRTRAGAGAVAIAGDASLLALVDRLGVLLDRSELTELAVQAGATRLVLRKPRRSRRRSSPRPAAAAERAGGTAPARRGRDRRRPRRRHPVPSRRQRAADRRLVRIAGPGLGAFVAVGREVAVGQVIGLIEAMKLFNEIKSDLAGGSSGSSPRTARW